MALLEKADELKDGHVEDDLIDLRSLGHTCFVYQSVSFQACSPCALVFRAVLVHVQM